MTRFFNALVPYLVGLAFILLAIDTFAPAGGM